MMTVSLQFFNFSLENKTMEAPGFFSSISFGFPARAFKLQPHSILFYLPFFFASGLDHMYNKKYLLTRRLSSEMYSSSQIFSCNLAPTQNRTNLDSNYNATHFCIIFLCYKTTKSLALIESSILSRF